MLVAEKSSQTGREMVERVGGGGEDLQAQEEGETGVQAEAVQEGVRGLQVGRAGESKG